MTKLSLALFSAAIIVSATSAPAWAAEGDETAIIQTLDAYEAALNVGDVKAIVSLYTPDGVQLAPGFPAAVGAQAIETSYTGTFEAISLDLDFTVDEIKLLGTQDAVLRTHSDGTLTVNGTNQSAAAAAFKELFLLHRQEDGSWKFTHYSFSEAGGALQ